MKDPAFLKKERGLSFTPEYIKGWQFMGKKV